MEKTLKIGILYICTGKYDEFFDQFRDSLDKFLPGTEKTIFIFTDSEKIKDGTPGQVKIYQEKLGWPYDTLMRYHMFLTQKDLLLKMDYLFFFNANMIINSIITEEDILPRENEELVAVLHSSFVNRRGTFETRKSSTAYLPENEGEFYYQGCLNGGTAENFMKMCEALRTNIDIDLQNKIIAVWHDESHMNCYMNNKNIKKLHPGFSYPEFLNMNYEKRIIMIEKQYRPGGTEGYRK
jgi:hypothetical protein